MNHLLKQLDMVWSVDLDSKALVGPVAPQHQSENQIRGKLIQLCEARWFGGFW